MRRRGGARRPAAPTGRPLERRLSVPAPAPALRLLRRQLHRLGSDSIDATGPNAGFYERASADEIGDYYQRVLEHQLLASGKVRFYGMSDYVGNWSREHAFRSRLTRRTTEVRARRRIVDARYLESSIPATHTPGFTVDPDARLVPVGQLPATGETCSVASRPAGCSAASTRPSSRRCFKGAILSRAERESLQQIERVVRLGCVLRIASDRIVLERGTVPTRRGELHVDCTGDGLSVVRACPIFEPGRITLQSLIGGQTSAAAAAIAFVESARDDDPTKNRLCVPHANPSRAIDFVRSMQTLLRDFGVRLAEPDLADWWDNARVNLTRGLGDRMADPAIQTAMARWAANMETTLTNAGRRLAAAVSMRGSTSHRSVAHPVATASVPPSS